MTFLRVPPTLEGEPDPGRVARLVFGVSDWRRRQPAEQMIDVAGAWQGLHYLITGDPWDGRAPESDIVCGGRLLTENGSAELGMDVIYLAPERVKPAADHLATTPFAEIARRFDVQRMIAAEVQDAAEWTAETRDRVLRPCYEALGRFFAAAATDGQAIYKVMG
jgi:hypothetical protein